ncbi:MAG TPA: lytic murein transglycosylase B [Candidatus Macondimonas sp.]|nr:lytic murein transglycosylase B [Candidatus Macondimonas sp.]
MKRLPGPLLAALLGLVPAGAALAQPAASSWIDPAQSEALISRMTKEPGISEATVRALLGEAVFRQDIIDAISRPYEAKPWYQYRALFLTPARIDGGVAFWQAHQTLLSEAEARYDVPAEIIVAIIGVETQFGRNLGRYRVLDALATLGFGYPKRGAFFLGELEHFIRLTREEQLDPRQTLGSYAGAMGMGQFIPSSYRAYAVDFDGDGQRNLWQPADAIGSVANYFARHGWKKHAPVAFPAAALTPQAQALGNQKRETPHTVASLRQSGIKTDAVLPEDLPANLLMLDQEAGPEYWIALPNFYVITRYNQSVLYAMAVFQLSQEIRRAYAAQT